MEATITMESQIEKVQLNLLQGPLSEDIKKFKKVVSECLNAYIQKHNLNKDDVNLMEEVISDTDEADPKKGKMDSRQRKADKRKRGLQYPEG